jgi:hypothetical protein
MRYDLPPVTPEQRAHVLRTTFDQMFLLIMEARDKRVDLTSEEGQARITELFPRMSWLFYDAFAHGAHSKMIEPWNPERYGLPADEPLIKPKGPTK